MSTKTSTGSVWKLLKIGLVADVLERYEFSIYGYLAGIMGQLFLQSTQPIAALTQAWGFFAIGYLARPLGSFFWGYVGDTAGRSRALKTSLLTISISTALIGVLPTYSQIGFLATGSLLFLRLTQGFAAGGELPVSGCYIFEASKARHRSLLCSTVAASSIIGFLGGSLVATLLFWFFHQETITAWAWRIPYLLSIPITLWVVHFRRTINEPNRPVRTFHHASNIPRVPSRSFFSSLNALGSQLLQVGLLGAFMEICAYTLFLWMPSYLVHFLDISPQIARSYNTLALVAWAAFSLIAGYLSGVFGYKRLLTAHIISIVLFSYPLFKGLQGASYSILFGIHMIFAWLLSGVNGVMMEVLGDAFPNKMRSTGMSLAFTLPATIFGSTTPLICTWLTDKTGLLLFPAFYMIAFGLLALPAALRLKSEPPSQCAPPLIAA